MGYKTERNGEFADTEDMVLFNGSLSGAGANNGPAIDVGERLGARLRIGVTAASGSSPTLDVKLQTRKDANDTWRDLASSGAFAQKTTVSAEQKTFVGFDRQIRYVATLGGTTPAFTFSVSGELV